MHNKGNCKQNEKTTYRIQENICTWCDWQGINLQNIQRAHIAQFKKKKYTIKEGEDLSRGS